MNTYLSNGIWGSLFSDPTIAKAFSANSVCDQMIAFEVAWTEALITVGAVSDVDGSAALDALKAFKPDIAALGTASEVDGLPVPEMVRQMRDGLGKSVAAAIHSGSTSQDVLDTVTAMIARDLSTDFKARGAGILSALDRLSAQFGENDLMGRTRMQAALPIGAQARIGSWKSPLAEALAGFDTAVDAIAKVQIGGPVGLRDMHRKGEEIAALMAEALGLAAAPVWHTSRNAVVDTGHSLLKLTGALGKIGQDIVLMAQQGIDDVKLNGGGGSSAMPHKQNPVRAEALVSLARFAAGQQGILGQALVHEQDRSGVAWALEWMTLPAMFEATGAALNNANALLDQITQIGAPK